MAALDHPAVLDRPGAVRPAEERDRAAVRALYHGLKEAHARRLPHIFSPACPDDFSNDSYTRCIAADDALLLVVERDSEIVAVAQANLVDHAGDDATRSRRAVYLTHLIAAPGARRQGHGRALMKAVAAWAWQLGADTIELCVWDGSDAAMAFYRTLGYRTLYTQLSLTVTEAAGGAEREPASG